MSAEGLADFSKNLDEVYSRMTKSLASTSRDYEWRMQQLRQLQRMLEENDREISAAMWSDLRKSPFECQATEQGIVLSEIKDALKNLKSWMKPRRVSTPLYNWPGRSMIVNEPYGLTLIIGAWNYPINLTLAPLVGAIVGGNACLIKPSEVSANTAHILASLVPKYLDPNLFAVLEGGPDETGLILDKKFDLIFFTGSGPVGKIVLAKAAPQLTPVVLELGGKSPCIVWTDADIKTAARRITWGKFMNAGQTCIAPDYLIVHSKIKNELIEEIRRCIKDFYGDDVSQSPDYCRIINEKNFDRLVRLAGSSKILLGGQTDRAQRFIAPTLVEPKLDDPILYEEIFGPYLPLVTIDTREGVAAYINSGPKPLALYVFTKDRETQSFLSIATSSGAVVINDVVMHMPVPELPFGGVGASGMGHYHGRFSFETFTHAKSILRKWSVFDLPVRYPPYNLTKAKILAWLFS